MHYHRQGAPSPEHGSPGDRPPQLFFLVVVLLAEPDPALLLEEELLVPLPGGLALFDFKLDPPL